MPLYYPLSHNACETWKSTVKIDQNSEAKCFPPTLPTKNTIHVTYRDHITNEKILHRAGSRRLSDTVAEHRFP